MTFAKDKKIPIGTTTLTEESMMNEDITYFETPGLSSLELQRLVGGLRPEEIKAIQSLDLNKQKHKEIERRAWEIYFLLIKLEYKPPTTLAKIFNKAWETATVFYNMAKEKEQETNNEV